MDVVYNYLELIPVPGPENPKFESGICKTCSKALLLLDKSAKTQGLDR